MFGYHKKATHNLYCGLPKLKGLFLYDPLNASLETQPTIILVGSCHWKILFFVIIKLPVGTEKLFIVTLFKGYFAV